MRQPVLTKCDFVQRYAAGEFGNASPTWHTLEEFLASHYRGLVHIRNRIAGGPTWYNVSSQALASVWKSACCRNGGAASLYISAMAPMEKCLIQGEVQRSIRFLDLTYSQVPLPMREALARETRVANGIVAKLLLEQYLCPKSLDWLWILLDEYPEHVVEFSTFSQEWGTLSGYNTVFWEVRYY